MQTPVTTNYTRPGHIDRVFRWNFMQQFNESGEKPVFVKPEEKPSKKKLV